jgi:5-methylcytosine-specific restriction endonuclease McrA
LDVATFSAKPTAEELAGMFREVAEQAAARPRRITDVTLMDYHGQYLVSPLWKRIKKRVLARDKDTCLSCCGRGSLVHHRSYERDVLEGKNDAMLATLCEGCHNIIHFNDDGSPRPQEDWDAVFLAGQPQTDIPPVGKIDLRRPVFTLPPGFDRTRMTALQFELYRQAHLQAIRDKREANRLRAERMNEKIVARGRD